MNNTTNNIVENNISNKAESSDATVENTGLNSNILKINKIFQNFLKSIRLKKIAPNETSVVSSGSNETHPNPNASIADLRERLQRIKSQI